MLIKKAVGLFHDIENATANIVLVLIALIPTLEVLVRRFFRSGLPSSDDYVQHLILWIAFIGGMITTREGKHLSLSSGFHHLKEPYKTWINTSASFVSVIVSSTLVWSALSLALIGFDPTRKIGFIPIRYVVMIMPLGFTVMTFRFITATSKKPALRAIVSLGVPIGFLIGLGPLINSLGAITAEINYPIPVNIETFLFSLNDSVYSILNIFHLPLIIIFIASAFLGTPIFIVLGGFTIIQFISSGGVLETVVDESYSMLSNPIVPSLPLFTFAGFILSASKAGERLVRLFRALFGWFPGGLVVMSILICAFFTTFTGASGVTILALGALLAIILTKNNFPRSFSLGLLTASGSIGLLFPPSLPIIMYGVVAQISIKDMFVGGLLPGLLMVATLVIIGVYIAIREKQKAKPFSLKEALSSLKESIWEILLPILILFLFLSGITTLVETGAIAVVYVLAVDMLIHREIKFKDLLTVFNKSIPIIGGVLIILALAKGLSYYIVDAEVPIYLVDWFQAHIPSKYVFLILLNIALLITGSLMDIFSALVVVAPLFIPLGAAYGIHPVHLGIIFLANLELGYLTPPVGINLFFASYRFNEPLGVIYRNVFPFLIFLLITVLIITYVPVMTTGLLGLF